MKKYLISSCCHLLRYIGATCLIAALPLLSYQSEASGWRGSTPCTQTAHLTFRACWNELRADLMIESGKCKNITDDAERHECSTDAWKDWLESRIGCYDQRGGRLELCHALGEYAYDPQLDPDDFSEDFSAQNTYFPLGIGDTREYVQVDDEEEIAEHIFVETLNKTKFIQEITCRVINDTVFESCDGEPCDLIEDTDDWYAIQNAGDVYYCGEESKDFEYTDGDMPREAELVEIGGSFKAGRDGDKMGIIFKAFPMVGDVYRQEWSLNNAEDWAKVLSTSYGTGDGFDADTEDPASLDYLVPEDLADYFCGNNECIVTKDGNSLEPDAIERKYHAPGVGVFMEIDLSEEEVVRLVNCSIAADLALNNYCGGDIPQPEEP